MNCEVEYGNIEYKRKLSIIDNRRIKSLANQIQWRLKEGCGKAIYRLGVNDNGTIYDFQNDEEKETLSAINVLTIIACAKIVNKQKIYIGNQYYYEITIYSNMVITNDKKIMIIGPPKSGKTSYLAYLIYGNQDNGNGYIRNKILRYEHEYCTGETSSLATKQIGYSKNKMITYDDNEEMIEIHNKSEYMITFFDSPSTYITKDFNLLNHMDHVLIMNNDNNEHYIQMCKSPYTIIDYSTILEPNFYGKIVSKQEKQQKLLFLNILITTNNEYLITCINYNYNINIGDKFYTFINVNQPLALITVKSIMYCNKHINELKSNITFTMTVECKSNLKKYKRNFFYKI